MENQHRHIKGYRELTQTEIDLMNKVKTKGVELQQLLTELCSHINKQSLDAMNSDGDAGKMEIARIDAAQPSRWLSIARTHFQEGTMAATRAIAQPTFF